MLLTAHVGKVAPLGRVGVEEGQEGSSWGAGHFLLLNLGGKFTGLFPSRKVTELYPS